MKPHFGLKTLQFGYSFDEVTGFGFPFVVNNGQTGPNIWSDNFQVLGNREHGAVTLEKKETLKVSECYSHSRSLYGSPHFVVSNSLRPHGLQPASFLCPWNSPGKTTEMGCQSLLQGIFPTQRLNLGLLDFGQILLPSEPPGKPLSEGSESYIENSIAGERKHRSEFRVAAPAGIYRTEHQKWGAPKST